LRQACQSLEEAHEVGLLHRDIKPANIFACHQGSEYDAVKVLDFGLVKLREQEGSDSVALTRADTITGTPLCLAPEIVLGSEDIDARSDLYSLGCVAYWLITGATVFEADTAVTMAVAHATEAPVPPSQRLGAPVPEDLEAIVLSLLAKDPADRPASAAELERQLAACGDAGAWTLEQARSWWKTRAPEVAKSSSEIASSVLSSSR
jgi:serine/threonine-protein kinase